MIPDLAVVGAGVMGAWTALHGQRGGRTTVLLDAWGPGNPRATSGDETRVIRSGHGADELYPAWARRAREAWRGLGEQTGRTLFVECGTLWLAHRRDGEEQATAGTLARLGIPVERLAPDEVAARWPQVAVDDLAFAVFEPEAGLLMARRGVTTVAERVAAEGGRVEVARVRPGRADGDRLLEVVDGTGRTWAAETFVFAAGPWLPELVPELGGLVAVTRQDTAWLGPAAGDTRFEAAALPCWIDVDAAIYGIPGVDGRPFKVAPDRPGPPFDPTDGERVVDRAVVDAARAHVARRFPGLAGAPVVESRVCQYESTADGHFLIDRHPRWRNAWVAGGGSGHGFKHGPVIGEHLVARLDGAPPAPGDRFGLARPRTARAHGGATGIPT